MNGKLMRYK